MVVIGLIVAFVLVVIFSRRGTRACRWRADRTGDKGALRKYRCAACGAEAFTATDGPPRDCKADVNRPRL
ncbi:hypothetical protein FDT80_12685 [Sulfitobacter sabulilitoris]|uniref:Uncharacterized protein n=1 Tax=Sulfitobacter sabulilitoris TaxID=2562655 RepID=A0A5S3PIT1_9RHOB|nr:hypothetical protein FDT80_12685 [Sulfitobacter sabulilitoris]